MRMRKLLSALLSSAIILNTLPLTVSAEQETELQLDLPVGLKRPEPVAVTEEEMAELSAQVREDYEKCTVSTNRKEAVYDFSTDYYYNQLDAEEKELYDKLDAACQKFINSDVELSSSYFSERITFSTNITNNELDQIYTAFYYSNPQYYFINGGYMYSVDGGSVTPAVIDKNDVSFRFPATRNEYSDAISDVTDSWMTEINACSTILEKERYIAEKLCDNIDYVFSSTDQTIAGALVDKECVCNGYAMAFSYFCNAVGIECISVVSYNHAWNRVKLYDNWYEVDTTWMDHTDIDFIWYDWYNKSTAYFLENDQNNSHIVETEPYANQFTLPVCTLNEVSVPAVTTPKITVTAGNGQATVKWSAVNGATQYRVYYRINGTSAWTLKGTTSTSITVTGLTNGKKYDFLVLAYNGSEWSSWTTSDIVNATPVALTAVTTPKITVTAGNGQATVKWNAVSGATQYRVYYRINGTSAWTLKGVTTTSYTVTGLTNGKKYDFLVLAYNGSEWSSWTTSDIVNATPVASAFSTPKITVTAGNGQATVKWNAVNGATQYRVYYRINGTSAWTLKGTASTSITVTGLTNGKKYDFLVLAYNGSEWSSWTTSDIVNATPVASAFSTPKITVTAGNGQATVKWSAVNGATQYRVYYRINGTSAWTLKGTASTSITVTGLTNGKKYDFLVLAYNGSEWSSWTTSDIVNATPENSFISEVIRLVNEERAKVGLSALTTTDALGQAANVRAVEIADTFNHTRPDGSSCFTVLNEFNISYRSAGENIAAGYATPEAVVAAWMNSEGHKSNILSSSFTKIGVGYYYSGSSGHNWVQIFTS